MLARVQPSWVVAMAATLAGASACRAREPVLEPSPAPVRASAPTLSEDDEALLASLLSDDPGDFHAHRARLWRIGEARWVSGGPVLAADPRGPRSTELEVPLEVVVVEAAGPRVLLPLAKLGDPSIGSALRVVAVLSATDLVTGLERELRPTPWLTLTAGVALTPIEGEADHLRVRWSDPACGFGLEVVVNARDFGPLYEPGPAGPPGDLPLPADQIPLSLAPGTPIYASAEASDPVVVLDEESSPTAHMRTAQQVTLGEAKPSHGRQQISLRCRGVIVHGYVPRSSVVENQARVGFVEPPPHPPSRCKLDEEAAPILVPRATPLYEPGGAAPGVLVGVTAADVEIPAQPGAGGWWHGCVPSPWGALQLDFHLI